MPSRRVLKLIEDVKKECKENGFEFKTHNTERIPDQFFCTGIFDGEGKSLEVAVNRRRWVFTLAHEFGHFKQWQEGLWVGDKAESYWEDFEAWLAGEEKLRPKRLLKCVREIQACESDAEQRAVQILERYKIPFAKDRYIKEANVYVWAYEAVRLTGKWYSYAPTSVMSIVNKAPSTFTASFGDLPEGYLETYQKRCAIRAEP